MENDEKNKELSDSAYDKMVGNKHEKKEVQLTDKMMKDMMPLFVEETEPDDHKCGICSMRIPREGSDVFAECTVVNNDINLKKGSCDYWAKGGPSDYDDKHDRRMSKDDGGYVETEGKINCSTCEFINGSRCDLWMGLVKPTQCCISWYEKKKNRASGVTAI